MSDGFLFDSFPAPAEAPVPAPVHAGADPWHLLIVDDEPEVHAVTRLALGKVRFKDRRLQLHSAYSAAEAEAMLRGPVPFAIVLLDVVMESDDAGLRLVRTIRDGIGNRAVRIILRTGQPGQAPEEDVIVGYDINDYKSKTELTTQKLFTTVVAALRSYADITALETSRRGLQQIIESTDGLLELRCMRQFAAGVLTQLTAFLGVPDNGILCAQRGDLCAGACASAGACSDDCIHVLAGAGRFAGVGDGPLERMVADHTVAAAIGAALSRRRTVFAADSTTLYIPVPDGQEVAAWVQTERPLSGLDQALVEVFVSKIAVGFSNVCLYERLKEANERLEARVAERTRELAEANASLERLATTDALTGVWNRRHIMDLAVAEVARARRYGRPLSVLLLDLDHFKRVNDTYGHAAGDRTLRAVVARARGALRTTDCLGRCGGEEFLILLPETAPEEARMVAERVRTAIAAGPMDFDGHSFALSASIGVAAWQEGESSVEQALRRADAALYDAKNAGRNRTAVAA
ncbi:diguanylate cyclase (GGDEF)-like protein [Azospirillum fermentarium]|uniref:diguanylate cyclase n=1 Tax=Azospirillum fermentarium TaxID=1233114 RepID=UPI002227E82C|nr:diguanylate cyclase [Azospirillum fermentarium]MCW2244615.1 diguanylate cyclase (GGDEF)-like protein [Azospirillum fermentarium]